jgi:hypothetical protein
LSICNEIASPSAERKQRKLTPRRKFRKGKDGCKSEGGFSGPKMIIGPFVVVLVWNSPLRVCQSLSYAVYAYRTANWIRKNFSTFSLTSTPLLNVPLIDSHLPCKQRLNSFTGRFNSQILYNKRNYTSSNALRRCMNMGRTCLKGCMIRKNVVRD